MSDDERGATPDLPPSEAQLAGLLRDLATLQAYLEERGRHTYELAQRFMDNARRDSSSRAYDERQATMLEYQHYIWHEIAGRLSQLIQVYSDETPTSATADDATTPSNTTGES